jgi:hypothetical protein
LAPVSAFKSLAALAVSAAVVSAQQQQPSPPPRFSDTVTVERLVVDVRVVDDLGAAVLGLAPNVIG